MSTQQQGRPGHRFIALCKPLTSTVLLPMVTDDKLFGVGHNDASKCLQVAVEHLPRYVREQYEGCERPLRRELRDPKVWEIAIAEIVVRSNHNYKDIAA